jgi:hypothetical protein
MSRYRTADTLRDSHSHLSAPWPVDIDIEGKVLKVHKKSYTLTYSPGDVEDLNTRFIEILEEVRVETLKQGLDNNAETQPTALPRMEHYLRQLRDVGTEAYALLPEDVFAYIAELELREQERGLSLNFTCPPEMALLWEMIYTGDPLGEVDLEKFWGFKYPIGHLFWESDICDWVRLDRGALALIHSELASSDHELTQIQKHIGNLNRYEEQRFDLYQLADAISREDLSSEKVLEYFGANEFAYGVVHFSCHCVNPGSAGASRAYLSLTTQEEEIQLSLGKFNVLGRRNKGFRKRPFIFLNACESSTPLHFLQSLNLPRAMSNYGAGGVIATSCTLPDNFAGAFAVKFYENLLSKPLGNQPAYIGQALLETRWHFMNKPYRNPLGLAYGLYALSNQRLRLE